MDDLPDRLEQLTARLGALERRVCALEHGAEAPAALDASEPCPPQVALASESEAAPFAQAAGVFSILGKAMLGIAGAYLLRAVAEMSSLPRLAVAAVAIAYALFWLVWAARVKTGEKAGEWLASTVYASTSALILAPLLWELTLRFQLLSAPAAAFLLCAFVAAASALAWKRNLAPIFWVAYSAAALEALALSVATHDMLPFILALLAMAALCEIAAHCHRESSVRPLLALAADLSVWGLIFIYTGPANARAEYQTIGAPGLLLPGCLLFSIFAGSVAYKTLRSGQKIAVFEAIQTLMAFLLAATSLLTFLPGSGAVVVGFVCLVLAIASYTAAFAFLDKQPERRNFHVFASWSAALFLVGCLLCLPAFWQAAVLGIAAVSATVLGVSRSRLTLEIHGLLYLAAAALACSLPGYALNALAGTLLAAPAGSVCLVLGCAAVCYAAGRPTKAEHRQQRLLHLLPALLVVCAGAALLVQGAVWMVSLHIAPDVFHIAFIRTLIACALALALAFCGSRWQRTELNWIAYATLVFVAAKLVFEDLRHGHMEFIAASIFLYAVTLIAVPRLARLGQRA